MKKVFSLAATLAAIATFSNAAVINTNTNTYEGSGNVSVSTNGGFNFDWNASSAPYAAYVDFETDSAFDLFLTSYLPGATGVSSFEVSGAILERRASLGGTVLEDLTNVISGCGNTLFSVISYNSCNYVTYSGYTGGGADTATQPGELFLGGLQAGFYRLALAESGTPATGSASFEVRDVAAIPLPAALPMLIVALGGLSIVARRRS